MKRPKFSKEQVSIFVITGLVTIFVFSGFYKQYYATYTELFTMMIFFLSLVGFFVALRNAEK
jgi:hypothetical protein